MGVWIGFHLPYRRFDAILVFMTEPTNAEILAAVDSLAGSVQRVDGTLGSLATHMQRVDGTLQNVQMDVHELNRRMGNVESQLGGVEDELHALSKAFDLDSERLVGHERRITALELKHT